ncbi:hypothetical protein [Leptobacterium sp. I13]|uniref:hypothetical protein n=1 Tax=Leptobacterium meishanense TaxID=3128904 RepID=UPI0030EE649E
MNLKRFFPFFAVTALVVTNISCSSSNDSNDGNVSINAKASINSSNIGSRNPDNVILTDFLINIREIEFEIDDDLDDNNIEDLIGEDKVELQGPFELDLLSGSTSINIANVDLPNNTYDEIEFDFHKSQNTSSELFDKSILIRGTINDVPFVFWHDTEEEFEVDFSNDTVDIVVDGGTTNITINFDLDIIFGAASSVDFSSATDGNNNGVIEINPNDDDGNRALADFIKNLLEESSDLLDD